MEIRKRVSLKLPILPEVLAQSMRGVSALELLPLVSKVVAKDSEGYVVRVKGLGFSGPARLLVKAGEPGKSPGLEVELEGRTKMGSFLAVYEEPVKLVTRVSASSANGKSALLDVELTLSSPSAYAYSSELEGLAKEIADRLAQLVLRSFSLVVPEEARAQPEERARAPPAAQPGPQQAPREPVEKEARRPEPPALPKPSAPHPPEEKAVQVAQRGQTRQEALVPRLSEALGEPSFLQRLLSSAALVDTIVLSEGTDLRTALGGLGQSGYVLINCASARLRVRILLKDGQVVGAWASIEGNVLLGTDALAKAASLRTTCLAYSVLPEAVEAGVRGGKG